MSYVRFSVAIKNAPTKTERQLNQSINQAELIIINMLAFLVINPVNKLGIEEINDITSELSLDFGNSANALNVEYTILLTSKKQ